MPSPKKEPTGCGCSNIPISIILIILGGGYWWFTEKGHLEISKFLENSKKINIHIFNPTITSSPNITPTASITPPFSVKITTTLAPNNNKILQKVIPKEKIELPQTPWEKKVIRGIYLTRYQVTNNADEQTIRERVRYYRSQGINTIIHGVWGNGCTMYNSDVMQQTFGYKSCPNQFQEQWLNWLIDEAHKQGMQVHAYFEKGIKIDKNSPIFDLAINRKWIVPGVDKTYSGIDHYVLDVEIPEVANLFQNILVEFVKKYPSIDAVQWDDYLGYYAELPGKVDRTANLTKFVQKMATSMKIANGSVSFDICHHNPYWAKKYFAADWEKWGVDRVFIQAYNDSNFVEELNYAQKYAGVAITDRQFGRLKELVDNPKIKSILVFPFSGNPEKTASSLKNSL
ncbi:family 10 glycosylhydrolase [Nostoc sp.]|uniref:family 10 glycosylhydrolase n=1 Tax=Nostoc sp. TaxID=1180 RepID=UPI002FFB99A6